jgi:hypothetical protein
MTTMIARYPGTCCECHKPIARGTTIVFYGRGQAAHAECGTMPVQRDNSSAEDACCGDAAYEDACARACGL